MATQMKLIFTGIILIIFFCLGCETTTAHRTQPKPDPAPPPSKIPEVALDELQYRPVCESHGGHLRFVNVTRDGSRVFGCGMGCYRKVKK